VQICDEVVACKGDLIIARAISLVHKAEETKSSAGELMMAMNKKKGGIKKKVKSKSETEKEKEKNEAQKVRDARTTELSEGTRNKSRNEERWNEERRNEERRNEERRNEEERSDKEQ